MSKDKISYRTEGHLVLRDSANTALAVQWVKGEKGLKLCVGPNAISISAGVLKKLVEIAPDVIADLEMT